MAKRNAVRRGLTKFVITAPSSESGSEDRIEQLTADNRWQGAAGMRFHSVSGFQITNTNFLRSSLSLAGTGFTRKSKMRPGILHIVDQRTEKKYNILNIPSTNQVFLVDLGACKLARNHFSSMFVLNLSGH